MRSEPEEEVSRARGALVAASVIPANFFSNLDRLTGEKGFFPEGCTYRGGQHQGTGGILCLVIPCSMHATIMQEAMVNHDRCDLNSEENASRVVHFRNAHGDIKDIRLPAETHGKRVYEELRKLSPSLLVATIHSLLIKEDHETIRFHAGDLIVEKHRTWGVRTEEVWSTNQALSRAAKQLGLQEELPRAAGTEIMGDPLGSGAPHRAATLARRKNKYQMISPQYENTHEHPTTPNER